MAEGTAVNNPDEIRQNIEETRASLDQKLHALENNVQNQVQNVKENVQSTVANVKEKLTPGHYIETHPWACFGAAVGVGFLLGQVANSAADHSPSFRRFKNDSGASSLANAGLMLAATKFFDKEIQDLKGYAITQGMGMARELLKGSVSPELAPKLGDVFDRATRYLGGNPASINGNPANA